MKMKLSLLIKTKNAYEKMLSQAPLTPCKSLVQHVLFSFLSRRIISSLHTLFYIFSWGMPLQGYNVMTQFLKSWMSLSIFYFECIPHSNIPPQTSPISKEDLINTNPSPPNVSSKDFKSTIYVLKIACTEIASFPNIIESSFPNIIESHVQHPQYKVSFSHFIWYFAVLYTATAKLAYMYICFELLILHVKRKNTDLQVPINKLFTNKKSINKLCSNK